MPKKNEQWQKDELPMVEVSKSDMKKIYLPMLYSGCYRIYVSAHASFFTMVLAYLVYLYFLVGLRAKPIYLLFFGFDVAKYVFLFVSILLLFFSYYFFQRHKIFSEFLLRLEKKIKLEGTDLSLRDLYLNDLYPKKSISNRIVVWFSERGRLAERRFWKDYTIADAIGLLLFIVLFIICIFVIFQV